MPLSQCGVEAPVAQASATPNAGRRDIGLYGGKLEGERARGSRKTEKRIGFRAFNVKFDESRHPVAADQCVEGDRLDINAPGPFLSFPAWSARACGDERVRRSGDRGVLEVEQQLELARSLADCEPLDRDAGVPTVKKLQRCCQRGLRLDRDNARAQAPKGCDAVADVRSHIENEVAWADKARVEPVHQGAALGIG